ncbi:hypothetical protein [Halomonas huangheensis]|uniref:Uncharacterized protein n=1 Tax=Halomonas huangheensis TaxID=1178482 RepID=W1NAD5_9GAMM|nr:hypothetical protein [Halomonas huangheensis]ALM54088.1 hypothetical protein AR456_18760 [Halomonas huangheensis]ERL52522.1 hypothetical protein BJB45_08190 [Halomonas huangheensis]
MSTENCFLGVCFTPLDVSGPTLFRFSEFLAGLALMVLAWTIADVRYRFRVRVAPIPLQRLTFFIVAAIGGLTLLTDLWRAEQWLVPQGILLTPATWQAILAGLFLFTFLAWAWFAFIKPPKYGKRNAERFAQTLYRFILKGAATELAVIADELTYSARSLVRHASDRDPIRHFHEDNSVSEPAPPKVEAYANDLLLLIANKRFCRVIVESSPITALAIFQEIGASKKYGIQVEIFAKNIVSEAINSKDSFLYNEAEAYESGLIGHHKPLSQAIFANHSMVSIIRTPLDPDVIGSMKWDADQFEAYCRVVLITLQDYVENHFREHSSVLYGTKRYIEHALFDLYKLNGVAGITWEGDIISRLRVIVEFIWKATEVLDKKGVPEGLTLRVRENSTPARESFYDLLASMVFEVIFASSNVKSPRWECWVIQHNSVWGELFNLGHLNNSAGRVVMFKVRRLLYNEVVNMKKFPNFKGAKILGFCLNVMGLNLRRGNYDKESRALHKAILSWTKKNYAWLYEYTPRVAEDCLVDSLSYDHNNLKIVKTFPAEGLRLEPQYDCLDIDPSLADERATR